PADHGVDASIDRALQICAQHGGRWDAVRRGGPQREGAGQPAAAGQSARAGQPAGAVSTWREAFLKEPYVRDTLVAIGVISETFETAITWERFGSLHERVSEAASDAVEQATGRSCGPGRGQARVTCRFTHVYPDGPALYYT